MMVNTTHWTIRFDFQVRPHIDNDMERFFGIL